MKASSWQVPDGDDISKEHSNDNDTGCHYEHDHSSPMRSVYWKLGPQCDSISRGRWGTVPINKFMSEDVIHGLYLSGEAVKRSRHDPGTVRDREYVSKHAHAFCCLGLRDLKFLPYRSFICLVTVTLRYVSDIPDLSKTFIMKIF
ncbi:hypothetical protein STEG23_012782 [Scotinomys teguina]